MKHNYFLVLALAVSTLVNAQIGTGFEEPFASVTMDYSDTQSPLSEHVLMNNGNGQPSVSHTFSGGELGFQSTFIPTRNGASGDDGLADGDAFGVFTDAGIILGSDATAWTTGNAFLMEDMDGTVRVEFDIVTLAGTTAPRFQMDYWIDDSTYEFSNNANDRLFIGLDIDNGASMITVFDSDGGGPGGGGSGDIDALGIETVLQSADIDISAHIGSNVRLIIEADCNSTAERFIIDNILFTEGTIATLGVNAARMAQIQVSPNPSQGAIKIQNLDAHGVTQLEVYDINGRRIANYALDSVGSVFDLDLQGQVQPGMYLLKFNSPQGTETKKIVIK